MVTFKGDGEFEAEPYEWRPAYGHRFDPYEPVPFAWLGVDYEPIEVAA